MDIRQEMIAESAQKAGVIDMKAPDTLARIAEHLPTDFKLEQIDLDEMPVLAEFSEVDSSAPQVVSLMDLAAQRTASIRAALAQLDIANNDHWTDDGLPRENIVRQLANDPNLSRRDIQSALPGFVRYVAPVTAQAPAKDDDAIERAEARVIAATNALSEARAATNAAARTEKECNARMAREISAWQNSFEPYTPQMLIREELARSQARRAERAARGHNPMVRPVANSRIDQQRAWARGGQHSGNSGRAVDMQTGRRVYPANLKGAKVPSAR